MISIVLSIALVIVLIVVLIDLLLWIAWKPKAKKTHKLEGELPFVSILIAARNEEKQINGLLKSLLALDYPKGRLEILIGDDNSTDSTYGLLLPFSEKHEHIFVEKIVQDPKSHKAKGGVLAVLGKKAKGEYLMFTDADIKLPSSWIKKHLACLKPDTAIQSGFTIIKKKGFLSSMQMIDWSLAMGMLKIVSGWKIPVTGVGNNMLIKAEAYHAVGGYHDLEYSITEDFTLFQKIIAKGYGYQQLANSETLAVSKPTKTFKDLLYQRKRWMVGAMQLPIPMRSLLLFQALYFPSVLILLFLNPLVGIPLFGLKTTIQSLFINKIHERLEEYMPIGHLFIFEFYSAFLTTVLCVYYLLPLPLIWKGRKIDRK